MINSSSLRWETSKSIVFRWPIFDFWMWILEFLVVLIRCWIFSHTLNTICCFEGKGNFPRIHNLHKIKIPSKESKQKPPNKSKQLIQKIQFWQLWHFAIQKLKLEIKKFKFSVKLSRVSFTKKAWKCRPLKWLQSNNNKVTCRLCGTAWLAGKKLQVICLD